MLCSRLSQLTTIQLAMTFLHTADAASYNCNDTQLSCHNTTVATNLCCINAPGGQLLQTQFWDSNPSNGPLQHWTIHGLWWVYKVCMWHCADASLLGQITAMVLSNPIVIPLETIQKLAAFCKVLVNKPLSTTWILIGSISMVIIYSFGQMNGQSTELVWALSLQTAIQIISQCKKSPTIFPAWCNSFKKLDTYTVRMLISSAANQVDPSIIDLE